MNRQSPKKVSRSRPHGSASKGTILRFPLPVVVALLLGLPSVVGSVAASTSTPVGAEPKAGIVSAPASVGGDPSASGGTKIFAAQDSGYGPTKLFRDLAYDFGFVKQAFNTVLVSPGDQVRVTEARKAGLTAFIEFDYKWDFISGVDITPKVQAIVDQVKANPGTVTGIHVADRLNSWANDPDGTGPRQALTPASMTEYLRQTGGAFHTQLPGIPVLSMSRITNSRVTVSDRPPAPAWMHPRACTGTRRTPCLASSRTPAI